MNKSGRELLDDHCEECLHRFTIVMSLVLQKANEITRTTPNTEISSGIDFTLDELLEELDRISDQFKEIIKQTPQTPIPDNYDSTKFSERYKEWKDKIAQLQSQLARLNKLQEDDGLF